MVPELVTSGIVADMTFSFDCQRDVEKLEKLGYFFIRA